MKKNINMNNVKRTAELFIFSILFGIGFGLCLSNVFNLIGCAIFSAVASIALFITVFDTMIHNPYED